MGKSLITSKTFWVNAIAFLMIILQASGVMPGADYASIEVGTLGVVNIVLRLVTGEPITSVVVGPEEEEE